LSIAAQPIWARTLRAATIALLVAASTFLAAPNHAWAQPAGDPIQTTAGLVQGFQRGALVEYMNVPFAAPTGGDARFLPPQPVAPWSGVRTETKSGPRCEQRGLGPAATGQSEDCLSIDIYAPVDAVGRRLPVIVWLYGGAFVLGSSAQYSPDTLVADNDVIVAIPNYRSGVFGFLALPEAVKYASGGAVGNAGLLDQQMALRWVRDNIAAFGGDPRNITLAGESAGAISVCAQLASPGARGLFAKAIIESGICGHNTNVFAPVAEAQRRAEAFAIEMGCDDDATRLICLRSLPAKQLLASPTNGLADMKLTWTPTRDGVVLPFEMPDAAIAAGSTPDVPIIIGTNTREGTTFIGLSELAGQHNIPDPDSYAAFVNHMFGPNAGAILAEYSVERFGSAIAAQSAVITDGMFSCPALFTAQTVTGAGHNNPVWQYEFSPGMLGSARAKLGGGAHAAELPYLFSKTNGLPSMLRGSAKALSQQMQRLWARFAYAGDPNAPDLPSWPRWTAGSPQNLEFGLEGSVPSTGFSDEHRCGFWDQLAGVS